VKRAPVAGLLALVLVTLMSAGSLQAYAPPQRGDPGYPEEARASYQSVGAKYADLIERQDWARLLEELEAEFFAGADSTEAERNALTGYRRAKKRFLNSLSAGLMDADSQAAMAGGVLANLTPAASVTEFAAKARRSDPLPRAVTGVFRTDSIGNVRSVFDASVRADQAERDSTRFEQVLAVMALGSLDDPDTHEIIRGLYMPPGQVPVTEDEARIAALDSLIAAAGSGPTAEQKNLIFARLAIPDPVFSRPRLDELFMLSDTIYSLLQDAMAPYRAATLEAIRSARQRWSDFTDHAMAHQFPWEMFINQGLGLTGSLESPPDRQIILLHPLLAVEFADPQLADAWRPFDEATVEDAMQVNFLGHQWLDANEGFARRISVSGCVSYRSDITRPGFGVSLGLKRWVDVGIIHRRIEGRDSYSVIFSADFWGLIKKEQSGFVRKSARWLEKAEGLLN
jgi:hypothetical protein